MLNTGKYLFKWLRLKTSILLICIWAAFSTSCIHMDSSREKQVSEQNLHVYLLIGQSNMAGRAPFTEAESHPIKGCSLLDSSGQWVAASNPLNRYSSIHKPSKPQRMGPGYSFARAMLEADSQLELGLVVNARGGSTIEEWAEGTVNYQEALRRVAEAQKTGHLMGVLWHQGEMNVENPDKYINKLCDLVARLRKDLDMPDLPFVAGQIDATPVINNQIALLPQRMSRTGYASSEGLTVFEEWHFDPPSVKELGKRYAAEMLKIQAMRKDN